MADLIDRAALLEKIDKNFFATCPEGDEQLGYLNSRNLIRTAPAVDAVEVVRCKDCKHLRKDGAYICCGRFHGMIVIRINDFCSYGERITDG